MEHSINLVDEIKDNKEVVSADDRFLSKNDRFLRHRRHEEVVSADGRFLSKHDRFFRHRRHKV